MAILRIICIVLVFAFHNANAQAPFKQSYDVVGDAFTKAYHTNTLDGGMILITRSTNPFVTPTKWFTLFKTFPNGDLQWSRRFKQPGNCGLSNIVQLPDSSYFFCFVELNYPEKYYITKLDPSGNLIYCRSLTPPPNFIVAFDPQCISKGDGNVYVASDLHNQSNSMFGWHLFEIDGAGNVVFSTCYNGGTLKCLERSFSLCANGDLLMTGYQRDSLAMHYGPVITRVDSAGNLLWSKLYLNSTTDIAGLSVFEMTNRHIVATATHTTPGNETVRIETDSAGNLLRSREYGHALYGLTPVTTHPAENQSMLIFGTTGGGAYCMKLDSVGNVLYTQRYTSMVPQRINLYYGGYSFSGVDYSTNHAVIFTADTTLLSCTDDTMHIDTAGIGFQTISISSSYSIQLMDTAFPLVDTLWAGVNTKDCGTIGVEETESLAATTFYPNPVSDVVTIRSSQHMRSIELLDISGRIILYQTVESNEVQLNITSVPRGCYIIHVVHEDTVESQRLIIE